MIYVPAGGARVVSAASDAVHAVVIVVPGGREGSARAGALPAAIAAAGGKYRFPDLLAANDAKTYGPATIYLDGSIMKGTPLAASILQLPAGAHVAEHVHAHETELLYMLAGSGTLTVAGTQLPIVPTSVIQIPPNTPHAFVAADAVRALQIYTPAGPEQRFKK
jgi:quercetin dioxygenase-like cupin family protein